MSDGIAGLAHSERSTTNSRGGRLHAGAEHSPALLAEPLDPQHLVHGLLELMLPAHARLEDGQQVPPLNLALLLP